MSKGIDKRRKQRRSYEEFVKDLWMIKSRLNIKRFKFMQEVLYSYNSSFKRRTVGVLQLKVVAQEASVSDENIGPILGQHGINAVKFCNEFNVRSFFFLKGLTLIVYLYYDLNKNVKDYYFVIIGPEVNFLFYNSLVGLSGQLDLMLIFKSLKLKKYLVANKLKFNGFNFLYLKSLFLGKSGGVKVKEFF